MTQPMRFLMEFYDLADFDLPILFFPISSGSTTVMASSMDSDRDQEVPDGEEPDVKAVQAHYLRSPSPSR